MKVYPASHGVSAAMGRLDVGESVTVKAHQVGFLYASGTVSIQRGPRVVVRRFNLLAGGSGVTPMVQVRVGVRFHTVVWSCGAGVCSAVRVVVAARVDADRTKLVPSYLESHASINGYCVTDGFFFPCDHLQLLRCLRAEAQRGIHLQATLLDSNTHAGHIMLKPELDAMCEQSRGDVVVHHFITRGDVGGRTAFGGRITKHAMEKLLHPVGTAGSVSPAGSWTRATAVALVHRVCARCVT